jgi:hypothetical protein
MYLLPSRLASLAELELSFKHAGEAHDLYARTSDDVEGMLTQTPEAVTREALLTEMSDLYEREFALLAKANNVAEAFSTIERVRGRIVTEMLRNVGDRSKLVAELNPALEDQITTLKLQLAKATGFAGPIVISRTGPAGDDRSANPAESLRPHPCLVRAHGRASGNLSDHNLPRHSLRTQLLSGRRLAMYSPPPPRKRKVDDKLVRANVFVLEIRTPGQDGLRCALFPFNWAVFERLLPSTGLESAGLDRCAISLFANKLGRKYRLFSGGSWNTNMTNPSSPLPHTPRLCHCQALARKRAEIIALAHY